ncbi:MAG: Hint domain-containing protein [Geminicoccaceae bacterium]
MGAPICFLEGTLIRTPEGERRIEDLRIGDEVVVHAGGSRPLKWIGHQVFKRRTARWLDSVEPILVRRGALAAESPCRELYVSPNHALYVDGVLVPAKFLVNGRSIVQQAPLHAADQIHYLHVEFETHEVVFAEGAAAESFTPWGGREHFNNFAEYLRLYPNEAPAPVRFYAPMVGNWSRIDRAVTHLRSAVAPLVDLRNDMERIRDRLAERAKALVG